MAPERRNRQPLIYNLKVVDSENGATLGYLANLGRDGLMVVSNDPVGEGERRHVHLLPPRNIPAGERIDLDVDVRWCRHRRAGHYSIGLQIRNTDEQTRRRVDELVNRFEQTAPEDTSDPYLQNVDPGALGLEDDRQGPHDQD